MNRIGQNLADEGLSVTTPSEGRAGGETGNEYSSTPLDLIWTTVNTKARLAPTFGPTMACLVTHCLFSSYHIQATAAATRNKLQPIAIG